MPLAGSWIVVVRGCSALFRPARGSHDYAIVTFVSSCRPITSTTPSEGLLIALESSDRRIAPGGRGGFDRCRQHPAG